jgi:hypothetical protein
MYCSHFRLNFIVVNILLKRKIPSGGVALHTNPSFPILTLR